MKTPSRCHIVVVLLALALSTGVALDAQTAAPLPSWTASDGRVTRARFVRLDGESVVIEKDGKQFPVPFAKLNAESVALAKRLSQQEPSVVASGAVPEGFALIPGGEFTMGDALDEDKNAAPHKVNVTAFHMQKKEVCKAEWDEVRAWGLKHGYTDLAVGAGKAAGHPVQTVSWYDIVKWCNAHSEMDGLTPCYTSSGAVCRTGSNPPDCNWSANGYRLPTEAEWEKAARGGLSGKRFPWGNTITHSQANYGSDKSVSYDMSPTRGAHPAYKTDKPPYTSPAGAFAPNGYGLHDMAGNVGEWCWDLYGTFPSALETDPRGAASGSCRVGRGGGWNNGARSCRVASRGFGIPGNSGSVGFRTARSAGP